MGAHARLSPSSAERWINCPASLRLVDSLGISESSDSIWAAEGTRAHELAEIEASKYFRLSTGKEYKARYAAWLRNANDHGDDVEEMREHARSYVSLLADIHAEMGKHAVIFLEQRMDTGIPGCWGTGDAVLVNPKQVHVVDFKYGMGVAVSAVENPQLRLYGLGALEMFDGVFGDAETVSMTIHQPRMHSVSHDTMSVADLRSWRADTVLPAVAESREPDAHFGPSEQACRWCPASGSCLARARWATERDFGNPNLMTAEQLSEAYGQINELRAWCNDVEAEALHQAYGEGVNLPGLKVVLSGGKRTITNTEKAIETLVAAGYTPEQVSKSTMRTLKELEKLVGVKQLPEILGDLMSRTPGRPSITDTSDARPAVTKLTEAQEEFRSRD